MYLEGTFKNLLEMEPSQSLNSCNALQIPECTGISIRFARPIHGRHSNVEFWQAMVKSLHMRIAFDSMLSRNNNALLHSLEQRPAVTTALPSTR